MKHVIEAKDYAADFAGKAYQELKGEVIRQKHLLVIIAGVAVVKTIAVAVIAVKHHKDNNDEHCRSNCRARCSASRKQAVGQYNMNSSDV